MDTSVKWTPRVGPCLSLFSLFKMDTSIGRTLSAGPKGVHLIKSWLYSFSYLSGLYMMRESADCIITELLRILHHWGEIWSTRLLSKKNWIAPIYSRLGTEIQNTQRRTYEKKKKDIPVTQELKLGTRGQRALAARPQPWSSCGSFKNLISWLIPQWTSFPWDHYYTLLLTYYKLINLHVVIELIASRWAWELQCLKS